MTCDNSSPKPKDPNKSNGNSKKRLMPVLYAAIIFVLVEIIAWRFALVASPGLASKIPAGITAVTALGGYVASWYGELKQRQACKDVGDFYQMIGLLLGVIIAIWA